jgi:hypothetical protein
MNSDYVYINTKEMLLCCYSGDCVYTIRTMCVGTFVFKNNIVCSPILYTHALLLKVTRNSYRGSGFQRSVSSATKLINQIIYTYLHYM